MWRGRELLANFVFTKFKRSETVKLLRENEKKIIIESYMYREMKWP